MAVNPETNEVTFLVSQKINGIEFEIEEVKDQFLNFHNTMIIRLNDFEIARLTDVYADFKDHRIDLVHYHNKLGAGFIDVGMISKMMKVNKEMYEALNNAHGLIITQLNQHPDDSILQAHLMEIEKALAKVEGKTK